MKLILHRYLSGYYAYTHVLNWAGIPAKSWLYLASVLKLQMRRYHFV